MKLKNFILTVLLILCIGVAAFSGYKLFEIYQVRQTVKDETQELLEHAVDSDTKTFSVDWEALKKKNPDIIAWIYIPQCDISYPVLQGTDNSYYLLHTIKGEYNILGSIFLDYAASPDFSDSNSIIYGHSADTSDMFTELVRYEKEDFFNEYPYFYLLTPAQNYRADIFLFSKVSEGSYVYTIDFGDYEDEVMDGMYAQALYSRPVSRDGRPLLTLSTCNLDYGYHSVQRLVLTSVLEPVSEVIEAE